MDVYKLLHQAAFGSEHAVSVPEAARRWLEQELSSLPPGPDEPLIDPICADRSVARVHLRPYLAGGFDPADLLAAFLRTAASPAWPSEILTADVDPDAAAAIDGALSLPGESLRSLLDRMRSSGFPPVHHSPPFVEAYRPAYRVVAARFLPESLRREE